MVRRLRSLAPPQRRRDPGPPARGRAPGRYSWLPGTGLNLIPRKATPVGANVEPSIVIAVQMMFVEVAAIAVVPCLTKFVFKVNSKST